MNNREHIFEFGANWRNFLDTVDSVSVGQAIKSLETMIPKVQLGSMNFLDVGSGSGLSSLAALRLGAKVTSFDSDPESVNCTVELKERYSRDNTNWAVLHGSILDKEFISKLGKFDFVYSWGVVHHTGNMWAAVENVKSLVADGGFLYLAIYNDQGFTTKIWRAIKRLYILSPSLLRKLILVTLYVRLWGPTTIKDFLKGRPFHTWKNYRSRRGMSAHYDVIDWVGGYPFETASPDQIVDTVGEGFCLVKIKTCGSGHGCNEFVFRKVIA